jgi:hypothetical protein
MESQASSLVTSPRGAQKFATSRSASPKSPTPRKRPRRRVRDTVTVVDKHLLTKIRERDFGVWTLEAHHAGDVSLKLDDDEVAYLSSKQGAPMLAVDACPYIRAAEIVTVLLSGLAVDLSVRLRAEFEFALARWIPLYFDL